MDIVTGMHRSGTSFLAQALHRLGGDFGPSDLLFKADRWNQNGYFENTEIVDINNRMILGDKARIDYWINAPESGLARALNSFASRKWKYFLFPGTPSVNARAANYDTAIRALHETYATCFVKDPRFCLTLPSWTARGPVNRLVFSYRNPAAVAGSLRQREGLPMWFGYRYWLYHVRGFLLQAPPEADILLVDFDAFFNEQTQAEAFQRLARYMGVPQTDPRYVEMVQAFDLRLRTQTLSVEGAPQMVRAAYDGLQALMAGAQSDRGTVRLANAPQLLASLA